MENRREILSYLDTVSMIVLAVVFFLFPLAFTSVELMTDPFMLPKQVVLGVGVLITLLLFGVRTLVESKLRLRSTPFDIPVFLFALVLFISAFLSVNRTDSLIAVIPAFFAVLLYYLVVNIVRDRKGLLMLIGALITGTAVASLITILSYLKIFPLPIASSHVQYFSTLGGLLDQAIVFGVVLPLAAYMTHPVFAAIMLRGKTENVDTKKLEGQHIAFGIASIVIVLGLVVTLIQLMTTQPPIILPFETGFQTAFSAISRDTGRVLQSFLFGSGYGTYLTDFTRFKEASYNADPKLWSFSFFRSSSFVLELLATVGFLGVVAYLFLLYRVVREKWFFLPIFLVGIASFFLPFSYIVQVLLFIILGIFALVRGQQNPRKYPTTELTLVAFNQGLLSAQPESEAHHKNSLILPVIFSLILGLVIVVLGYTSGRFVLSDLTFQKSIKAAQSNNGGATYQLQREAISQFPWRDAYYRIFSQTNLALANNLAAAQPKGASPSAETQQTILTLIQQSINSGRSAVTISPLTTMNWNSLSSVYRSLIGFGQNADQFSILTNQQAIALDPNNPQQYINLGGIYYQLGQWEEAQRNFQIAINLKPDYANAYYNLGHSLESKGDYKNALSVYQAVRTMVGKDAESLAQIDKEIAAIQLKIGQQGNASAQNPSQEQQTPSSLGVNQPNQQLPERNPKVEIPGVTISPTPKVSQAPSQAPESSPTVTAAPTPSL